MPKIEVNEKLFFNLLGEDRCGYDILEERLVCGKAELDEKPDASQPEDKRVIKIELNDTNRPDLWSTGGIARQLRLHSGGRRSDYSLFMSYPENAKDCGGRIAVVDGRLEKIRPYMAAFVISGKPIDEPMLLDIIQTQEKLCWNFGRKRRSVSMGVYRSAFIRWPVHYTAADPDAVSFVPLQGEEKMTCRQILTDHPKGKEYGWILKDEKLFPLLRDDTEEILSMPPIINSAKLGAVKVGDGDLLVEMTGADMPSLLLAANIVACDFADAGYSILPCRVDHPYDTGFGKTVVTPFYFQQPAYVSLERANRLLGSSLDGAQVTGALERMGNTVSSCVMPDGDIQFTVLPPPYRNDFLHEVDVIEDIMIGMGLAAFQPERPHDFTIGRLSAVTLYSRRVKSLMTGMGYQEMIFNYLGSRKDYIERMNIDGSSVIEIANPMSENYQFVRPSIIASLLAAESGSANAAYPHKIYETGKVAYLCGEEVTGTRTRQNLGFLFASGTANFNDAASEVSTLLHFLGCKYTVKEADDPRFIPGRQALLLKEGRQAGIFGEIHPAVLENWDITVPCVAGEIDLEELMDQPPEASAPKSEGAHEDGNDDAARFDKYISLKVAKITSVQRHPNADKLYVETLDDGSGTERRILSGLVPYVPAEELLGKSVIIADNLKPRKMRGMESRGMLLAAGCPAPDGGEIVEVLDCPWAAPGTPVVLENAAGSEKPAEIDADTFFSVPITVKGGGVFVGGRRLTAAGRPVLTSVVADGSVE